MDNYRISLELVPSKFIAEILSLWDETEINKDRQSEFLTKPTVFKTWLRTNNREPLPIRNILSLIHHKHKAFGIFETPYVDLEFWDSHVGFYGTCFTQKDRDCRRLHFFKLSDYLRKEGQEQKIGEEAIRLLEAGATENQIYALGLEYCGYSVFRPIPSNVIGRTAISFDNTPTWHLHGGEQIHPQNIAGKPFLKAKQRCSATILNARFYVDTPEFIQQDPNLGQCASASLWVASGIASKKFGTGHVKFPSITKNAVGGRLPNIPTGYAPLEPNTGLSTAEIKNALSATGSMYQSYAPKVRHEDNVSIALRLGNFIYSYVESGLPVILCMHGANAPVGHAVAAVGHFLPTEISEGKFIPLGQATGVDLHNRHFLVSSVIDLYYVHDDCSGPFNKLQLVMESDPPAAKRKCVCDTIFPQQAPPLVAEKPKMRIKLDKRKEEFNLIEAIAPVHFRIRNNPWDSLPVVIDEHHKYFGDDYPQESVFLWRSFLTSGSEFKRTIVQRGYTAVCLAFYAKLHLPKYIWVHEFTETRSGEIHLCFDKEQGRQIDGEYIVDATTAKNDIQILSARVGKALWVNPEEVEFDSDARGFPCFEQRQIELPEAKEKQDAP